MPCLLPCHLRECGAARTHQAFCFLQSESAWARRQGTCVVGISDSLTHIVKGGLGTADADADGVEAAGWAVREQAPVHKKKADVRKQHAPAAAGGLAPTGEEGGHETDGGATAKQAVKQAGASVSGVSKEGLVKIKIDYPYPHTWVFEQQPKRAAYGGIGFAKPSTWLPMPADRNSVEYSDFIDKFEEVWPSAIQPSPDLHTLSLKLDASSRSRGLASTCREFRNLNGNQRVK